MIPKDQIEKLQNSISIVDVIGERIDIKRAGANYKARCPFHDEKTPSFMISDSKQIFKCFGCGASGDPIKFVMMFDNLSYPDAVRHLASRYGVEIKEVYDSSRFDKNDEDKKELFRILNRYACEFFHENMLNELSREKSAAALYIRKRKIDNDLLRKFMIGYAPDDWHALRNDIRLNQYSDELLVEAGLLKKNEKGNIYDQFRNRLIFPVCDQLGNVVAFSGRALDDETQPKYLNSPETVLYKKNQILYGIYQAMESVRRSREIILVEGNVDLITMHKNGYANTVAICGTAFTENHALIIKRNADRIILMLDGDSAGKKSAVRTSEILLDAGIVPDIVLLPDESDPDSFLNDRGKSELDKLLSSPVNIVDVNISAAGDQMLNTNDKAVVARSVIGSLKHIRDMVTLDLYLKEASLKLGVDIRALKKELDKEVYKDTTKKHDQGFLKQGYIPNNEDIVDFSLIYLMISDETSRQRILSEITEKDMRNSEAARLFLNVYKLVEEGEPVKLNNILIDFDEKFKDFMIGFVINQEKVFSGEVLKDGINTQINAFKTACSDSLKKIMLRKIAEKIKNLNTELKYTDDHERQNEILQQLTELKNEQIGITKN